MAVIFAFADWAATRCSVARMLRSRSVSARRSLIGTGVRRSAETVGTTSRVSTFGAAHAVKISADARINRTVRIGKVSYQQGLDALLQFGGAGRFALAMRSLYRAGKFRLLRDVPLHRNLAGKPVILDGEAQKLWLDPETDPALLLELAVPAPDGTLAVSAV